MDIDQLFDVPEEEIPEVIRLRKLKLPLLDYEITFKNNHSGSK